MSDLMVVIAISLFGFALIGYVDFCARLIADAFVEEPIEKSDTSVPLFKLRFRLR